MSMVFSESGTAVALALLALWSVIVAYAVWKANRKAARSAAAVLLFAIAFIHGAFVFSKGDGGDSQNTSPPRLTAPRPVSYFTDSQKSARFVLASVATNAVFDLSMPTNAVVIAPWRIRGAANDSAFVSTTNAFFRLGTNAVNFVRIDSSGALAWNAGFFNHEPFDIPDGSSASVLAPLHTALGVVPECNWSAAGVTNSCVWHAETRNGLLVTWSSVLAGREAGNPVSFQVELKRNGDFIYRLDIPDGSVVSNFVTGAQHYGGGETADLGDALVGPMKLELRWKSIADFDFSSSDQDSDVLSDRDEIFVYGTDPLSSDTDLDGLSDSAELVLGSDPLRFDTDGDGLDDGNDPDPTVAAQADLHGFSNLWADLNYPEFQVGNHGSYRDFLQDITENDEYSWWYTVEVELDGNADDSVSHICIGNRRIVVSGNGTYEFLLERGVTHDIRVVTDGRAEISSDCEDAVIGFDGETGSTSTAGSGRLIVTPGGHHFYGEGESEWFTALCGDVHPDAPQNWNWTSDEPGLTFAGTGASRNIAWTAFTSAWQRAEITVSCTVGNTDLSTTFWVTAGLYSDPRVCVNLDVPRVIFLNNDDDAEEVGAEDFESPDCTENGPLSNDDDDLLPVNISYFSDIPTNGTVVLRAVSGGSCVKFWTDARKTRRIELPAEFEIQGESTSGGWTVYMEGVATSGNGDTVLAAEFDDAAQPTVANGVASTTVVDVQDAEIENADPMGTVVLLGSNVTFRLLYEPQRFDLAEHVVCDWKTARRRTRSLHDPAVSIGVVSNGLSLTANMDAPGCHRVSVDVSTPFVRREVFMLKKSFAPYDNDPIGSRDYIGVASTQEQITLRNEALSHLGDTDFAKDSTLASYGPFSGISSNEWKCNHFVAYCAVASGLNVPVKHSLRRNAYPPAANDWADSAKALENWGFVAPSNVFEPGFIVASPGTLRGKWPFQTQELGHTGIVDYNGHAIAAGKSEVHRRHALLHDDCKYRKYEEKTQ